jgi:hypothetical protein
MLTGMLLRYAGKYRLDLKRPEPLLKPLNLLQGENGKRVASAVQTTLQNSICRTMQEIMGRIPGSARGPMYGREYCTHVLGDNNPDILHRSVSIRNANLPCFTLAENDSCQFITKDGISPSDALHSFLEGPVAADCGSTVEAVYLKAIYDLLGQKKFDILFTAPHEKFQIRKWVCPDLESSLYPFVDFADPHLYATTDPRQLRVGDHILALGVPWHIIKHPGNHMQNMHALVIGYNAQQEPLIAGLGIQQPQTLTLAYEYLIQATNAPQSQEEAKFIQLFGEDAYYSRRIEELNRTLQKPIHRENLFKQWSIGEVRTYGHFTLRNEHTCRLSICTLSILMVSSESDPLRTISQYAKAFQLQSQIEKAQETQFTCQS